jgi:hypothetical protein
MCRSSKPLRFKEDIEMKLYTFLTLPVGGGKSSAVLLTLPTVSLHNP